MNFRLNVLFSRREKVPIAARPPSAAHDLPTIGDETMSSGNYASEYKKANHSVGVNEYHMEFCPKYRFKCMKNPYMNAEIERLILQSADEHHIPVKSHAIGFDHVHLQVFVPFYMSPSHASGLIKGRSAFLIFQRFPNLRRRYPRGHFWSPGTFIRSISGVTADVIEHYIENQQFDKLHQTIDQAKIESKQMFLSDF